MQRVSVMAERLRIWGLAAAVGPVMVSAACGEATSPASGLDGAGLGDVVETDTPSPDTGDPPPPDDAVTSDVAEAEVGPRHPFVFVPGPPPGISTSARFRLDAAFSSQPYAASPPASPRFRLGPEETP